MKRVIALLVATTVLSVLPACSVLQGLTRAEVGQDLETVGEDAETAGEVIEHAGEAAETVAHELEGG